MSSTNTQLNAQILHELLSYDPLIGVFAWKKARRGVVVGKPLGTDNGNGYLRITVLGRSEYAHRLAWMYVHGEMPKNHIDHINGNKQDNRIANLRDVTNAENAQNKPNATGVSWHKKAGKWQAHICVHKRKTYLGLFNDFDAASAAYKQAKESANVGV